MSRLRLDPSLVFAIVLDVFLTFALAVIWRVVRLSEVLFGGESPPPTRSGVLLLALATAVLVVVALTLVSRRRWSTSRVAVALIAGPVAFTLVVPPLLFFPERMGVLADWSLTGILMPGMADVDPPWPWLVVWLPALVAVAAALIAHRVSAPALPAQLD